MDDEVDWSPEKENEYAPLPVLEEDDKMEGSSSSVTAGRMSSPVLPSVNEVRLSKRLEQVERERDAAVAELQEIKSRQTAPPPTQIEGRIVIPQELLPTLNVLQHHIAELTRDNEALRYTFIGPHGTSAPATATAGQKTPNGMLSPTSTATAGPPETALNPSPSPNPNPMPGLPSKVDLAAVVTRVKALLKENEELGEMVFELGRTSPEAWQQALDESKAVISSLDSDLTHHLGVIQSLRAELEGYRARYGSLDNDNKDASAASRGPASSTIAASPSHMSKTETSSGRRESDARHRSSHRPEDTSRRHDGRSDARDRDRDRDRDRNRDRDRDRDKYRRDRDRDGQAHDKPTQKDKEQVSGPRGGGGGGGGANGLSIMGHAHSHSRDDARDRDPKRRK